MSASSRNIDSRFRFALVLALVVSLVTLPRLLLHELWRDEAWLWIVATTSPDLPALFHELSRSGQGYLFPLLAWCTARLSSSPHALQLLNLAIVVAGAFVLGRWAPLRRVECVLLVFGYYIGYEYAVLSRHYALGVLLLFVACAAARSGRAPIVLGLALGLLCQTTVYGFILASCVAAAAIWLHFEQRRQGAPALPAARVVCAALLAAAGAVAGLVQLVPEAGTAFAVGWRMHLDSSIAIETLQLPWRALLPLPRPQLEAWNSDLLAHLPGWRALAGVAALALAFFLLWPRKLALAVFALATAGLLAFAYVKYVGTMRHHGHLWLGFVAALWLAGGVGAQDAAVRTRREWVLLALLVLQVSATVFVSALDLRHPFSNGARTAALIRAQGHADMPLLGYREPPAASVALALGQPLYAPSRQRFATHTDWGPLQRDVSLEELRCAARALAQRMQSDVLLVMTTALPAWPEVELTARVEGAMVASENYLLYVLDGDALGATADSTTACDPDH